MTKSMSKEMIKAIIILPGTVGVIIPAILLYFSVTQGLQGKIFSARGDTMALGLVFLVFGSMLAVKTSRLFLTLGQGTPAPWMPPRKLVVAGPYRYVRNPMISGMILILLGESLVFGSFLIFIWTVIFFAGNMIYFPLSEEKNLIKRFGQDYLEYKKNVPRWIPRLTPWIKNNK